MIDIYNPTVTHPFAEGKEQSWCSSLSKPNTYYFWVQQVSHEVQLLSEDPAEVDLGFDSHLNVYKSLGKQELLYQITFKTKPNRFLIRPTDNPHSLFWTFGKAGGSSYKIKYLFKDKYLSIHSWVDKDSFLAVIRTENFCSFWSR